MKKLILFIFLLLLIGCRPTDNTVLKNIQSGIDILNDGQNIIHTEIANLSQEMKVLIKNDSIMVIQLRHFPSTTPIKLEEMKKVTSVYNERVDPITKKKQFHWGIDYSAKIGTKVYATADGIVEQVNNDGNYGNVIKITQGNGYDTSFGHLDKMYVKFGQIINQGDIIGTVGNTGKSTGPHLHYEISYLQQKINPNIFKII